MPDLDTERFHFRRLLEALQLRPEYIQKGETPDFMMRCDRSRIGVEITRFILPSDGEREMALAANAELAVDVARRIFRERGGPALYVAVYVAHEPSKRQAYDLGRRLADVVQELHVRRQKPDGRLSLNHLTRLPEIVDITIHPSVDGVDELWQVPRAGWVAEARQAHVQSAIDKKAPKIPACREKCKTLWLGIAHDDFRNGAPCRLSTEAANARYAHDFDRVFWVNVQVPSAMELRRRAA